MSNEDQHALPPGTPNSAQQTPPDLSPQGAARRRFGRAGLGASGVIMTLASQPGMATTVCRPPSGFLSGTWASNHPKATWCYGAKPTDWCANKSQWYAYARTDYSKQFYRVFACTGNTQSLRLYTLYQIVAGECSTKDRDEVAKYIVAALLNARAGTTPVLTEEKIFQIWNEYTSSLKYTPTAGAKAWNGKEIVNYLKSTMVGYGGYY